MRRSFAPLCGFMSACAILLAASAAAGAPPPLLSADPAPGALAPSSLQGAVRSRSIAVDFALLDSLASGAASEVGLAPFEDAPLEGTIKRRVVRGPQSYTLSGSIARRPHASFTIVREQGAVVGVIRDFGKPSYAIEPVAPGLQRAVEIDLAAQPPCGTKDSPPKPPGLFPPTRDAAPVKSCLPAYPDGEDGTVIDIMMVYTPGVTAAMGSVAAVDALINMAIDDANAAFTDSLVDMQFRLAHSEQVSYADTGNLNTDLSRVTTGGDGFMDNVQALRDTHRADIVSLLVATGGPFCGLGWVLNSFFFTAGDYAYSTCAYGCLFGATFAHEAGHNMGCNHDRPNAGGAQLFNYSFGYTFTGQSSSQWGTIMSYEGTRVLRYSNPDALYDGVATGIASPATNSADNARTINLSRTFIANYRQSLDDAAFTLGPEDDFLASGPAGGPFAPSCGQYTLDNNGAAPINWSVVGAPPWLDVSPTSGTLAPSGSQIVDVCIDASATSMTAGAYAATLTFDSGGQGISRRRKATLRIEGIASVPFEDSFDAPAEPGAPWRISGTSEWCVMSDAAGGNPDGPQSILLHEDGLVAGSSRAELALAIDLAGRQRVRLQFIGKLGTSESIDGSPPPSYTSSPNYDGIAISEDGVTWHVISRFPGITSFWTFFEIDLDDAIAAAGINYSSDFRIKFTQYGPSRAPNYGLYLDKLSVFEAPNVTRSWLDYE